MTMFILENSLAENNEETSTSLKINPTKSIQIDFKYPPFNKNPNEIENAVLFFKDTISGKIMKINLQEKSANSSVFQGQFIISWSNSGELQAEIYLPPQKTAQSKDAGSIVGMINEGTLPRKPYFLRNENGKQLLTIYNSPEQATAAYDNYRKVILAASTPANPVPILNKPLIDKSVLEAQRAQELAKAKALQEQRSREQELLRKQLEETERIRQDELKKQQLALAEQEIIKRKAQAKKLAENALKLYKAGKFLEAEEKFKQSTELDPNNNAYHYQYGITLYKIDKFNEAIVALKLSADNADINPNEKTFYKGLCYMKLKEFDSSLSEFKKVSVSKDTNLAPTATFFSGVILFTKQKYKEAKVEFEKTLEISNDPKMSDQADSYIEQIANIEQFEEKRKKRFTLDLGTGVMYDSNVLQLSNSSASATALNKAGIRGLLNVGLEYRALFTESYESTFQYTYTDMYTQTTGFKSDANLQKADPLMMQYKLPTKFKFKMFDKPFQLSLTPGLDIVNLNIDDTPMRERILNSTYLATDQTFVINPNYITTVSLEFRNDDSRIPSDDASSAYKTTLANNHILFLDQKKTEAWLINWDFINNNAHGDEKKYIKYDLSLGFMMPHHEKNSFVTMLALTSSNYSKSSTNRKDSGYTLTTSYSHPFTESIKGGASLSYNNNKSTVDTSTYDKFTISTTVSWTGDF